MIGPDVGRSWSLVSAFCGVVEGCWHVNLQNARHRGSSLNTIRFVLTHTFGMFSESCITHVAYCIRRGGLGHICRAPVSCMESEGSMFETKRVCRFRMSVYLELFDSRGVTTDETQTSCSVRDVVLERASPTRSVWVPGVGRWGQFNQLRIVVPCSASLRARKTKLSQRDPN